MSRFRQIRLCSLHRMLKTFRCFIPLRRTVPVERRLFLLQKALILPRERVFAEQVGARLLRAQKRLPAAPFPYVFVVPAHEHLRHGASAPHGRPRVLRVLEQAVEMAFLLEADVLGEHARQHARHGVRQDDGRQLAAGEHEIADGDLLHAVFLEHALIHALPSSPISFPVLSSTARCNVFSSSRTLPGQR